MLYVALSWYFLVDLNKMDKCHQDFDICIVGVDVVVDVGGCSRGFSFDVFLTKILFDVLSNASICFSNPQNDFNAVFTRNNRIFCKQLRRNKNHKLERLKK